jgi:hypothetical protein
MQSIYEYVLFENSNKSLLTRNIKFSFTMLDSFMPLTLVNTSIIPKHLSIALSHILKEVPFIEVTRLPKKLPVA